MEEDNSIKRKKIFKKISKYFSNTLLTVLIIIAGFFLTYIICNKVAKSRGVNPPFGLYTIISASMEPNIDVYDVVFVKKTNPEELKVNDVITFYSTNSFFGSTPITHRIVEILDVPNNGILYKVKGDANNTADDERVIPANILGRVVFKIPSLGKIQFFLASRTGWIIAIIIPSILIITYDIYKIIKLAKLRKKITLLNENSIV